MLFFFTPPLTRGMSTCSPSLLLYSREREMHWVGDDTHKKKQDDTRSKVSTTSGSHKKVKIIFLFILYYECLLDSYSLFGQLQCSLKRELFKRIDCPIRNPQIPQRRKAIRLSFHIEKNSKTNLTDLGHGHIGVILSYLVPPFRCKKFNSSSKVVYDSTVHFPFEKQPLHR